MIYGYEEGDVLTHSLSRSLSNPNAEFAEIHLLDEKRESIKSDKEYDKTDYSRARYLCVGSICQEINEQKDKYASIVAKQKDLYYKDTPDEDAWLKEYAEKTYKQYDMFQEEEEENRRYHVPPQSETDEFPEVFNTSEAQLTQKCEDFLTIPEYAYKMLRDTLDECEGIIPIIGGIPTNGELEYGGDTDSGDDVYNYRMGPSKSEEYFAYVPDQKKEFSQWPSAEQFNVELGAYKIDEYLSAFDTEEDWLYVIYYQGKQITHCSDLYKYQAIYSLPTWRYPIAQATASIYFVVEVCKVKPPHCPVDVTFKYETFRHTFKPGHLDFNEKWLHHILDAKINLFKTLTY